MGRRISGLSNPMESLRKKELIAKHLEAVWMDPTLKRVDATGGIAFRLSFRRYLQKVLWSLSVKELEAWTELDSINLMKAALKRSKVI